MSEQQSQEVSFESALDAMPLAPLPPTLANRIMAQIQPAYVPEPFRLSRADALWAGVASLIFGLVMLVGLSWLGIVELGGISAEIPQLTWLTPITTVALAAIPIQLLLAYALNETLND